MQLGRPWGLVNAIAAGWFPSEMTVPRRGRRPFLIWAKRLAPMGRVGNLEESIGPLLFLASEASIFVTDHTLVGDGGFTGSSGATPFPDEVYQLLAETFPEETVKLICPS